MIATDWVVVNFSTHICPSLTEYYFCLSLASSILVALGSTIVTKTTITILTTGQAREFVGTLLCLSVGHQLVGELCPRADCFPNCYVFLVLLCFAKGPGLGIKVGHDDIYFYRCSIGGMAQLNGGRTLGVLCDPGLLRQAGLLHWNNAMWAPAARCSHDAPLLHEGGFIATGTG